MLRTDACFKLKPSRRARPEIQLVSELAKYDFEPHRCHELVMAEIDANRVDPRWFNLSDIPCGAMLASAELAYARTIDVGETWDWSLLESGRPHFAATVPTHAIQRLSSVLRPGFAPAHVAREHATRILGQRMTTAMFGDPAATMTENRCAWRRAQSPGIYRREHASIVFRSRTTSIVIDPQGTHYAWTTDYGRAPRTDDEETFDAVMVTHSHDDHLHIPSILRACSSAHTPVVVPVVGQRNLLCEDDMAAQLRLVGQQVIEAAWWSSVKIGDIIVDVLPFYGEQPLRDRSLPLPHLRNFGNCYRLTCSDFSAIILVDSGQDCEGSMHDVVTRSIAERGPIDVLLSCCLTFKEGWNPGLPHYALVVPLSDLHAMATKRLSQGSMTLGITGIANLCRAIQCPWFLPYAHGFSGIDVPVEQGTRNEATTVALLVDALASTSTHVVGWNPGDAFRWRGAKSDVDRS